MKFDEIEINGKLKSAAFKRPTYRHKMDYLKSVLPLQKEAALFQKEVQSGEVKNPEKGIEILNTLNRARWKILLELHNGEEVFKIEDDFQDVADRDLDKIYTWMQSEMGLEKTKEEQGFLSESKK